MLALKCLLLILGVGLFSSSGIMVAHDITSQQGSDACLSKPAEARVTAVQSYNEEEKQ